MNAARSFRQTLGDLPTRYRTPSPPPRDAVEPLSPHGVGDYHNWPQEHNASIAQGLGLSLVDFGGQQRDAAYEQQLWVDGNGQARIDSFNSNGGRSTATRRNTYDDHRVTSWKDGSQKRDGKGHARSGSSIDALATIALATSPTFSQGSPSFTQSPWPTYTFSRGYQHDYSLDERPPKRAKSEKLPSPQMSRKQSRPATSHVNSLESMKNDAELLLNFAQPHNFPPLAKLTPPQRPQPEQESPPYKRLSTSTTASEQTGVAVDNGDQQDSQGFRILHRESDDSGKKEDSNNVQSAVTDEIPLMETKQEIGTDMDEVNGLKNESNATQTIPHHTTTSEDQLIASALPMAGMEKRKPRRIQPTTQAPCAKCNSLQATVGTEDQDGLTSWVGCNSCERWFHIICAGFKDGREVRTVDKYICPDCEPLKGPTTFVRKSSRARASIDYAGLNQGMVQSSEETAEHHWLKPIKDGKIKFQPDDFARIRPELLTTEYLEKTDGMKRPIVIPACWNRPCGRQKMEDSSVENAEADEAEVIMDSEGNEATLKSSWAGLDDQEEEVLDCGQDLLDMVMPRNLTVRRVAEMHGPDMPLDVIDVKSQQTAQKWNLKKWADYYESTGEKTIRNVISLEVSQSKLGKLLRRPKIVRDIDLQDAVWPPELPSKAVQFYCLMSVADCYTDFHIDFGGSSVYYHILKGKKTFFFIPPEEKYLKKYEQWNNSPLQNQTFLGEVTGDCSRVDLCEGDTMLIPSGWIHAVWTPENSLVIGGNFLTRMSYEMQIRVNQIERDTKTALKFRYPLFQKVNWYAAIRYLEDDPVPEEVLHDFEDDPDYCFLRANPIWHEFGDLVSDAEPGDPDYNARFYSRMEIEGLPALRDYLYRTALIASDFHVDGVNESTRTSVKRSVPKGHGEPMELIRTFGIWVAWKMGCVLAPDWVRPDSPSSASLARKAEQQKSDLVRTPGERMSSRVQSQLEHARAEVSNTPIKGQTSSAEPEMAREESKRPKRTPKTSGLGPQRFACDPCRKRRIRCRHRDGEALNPSTESGRPRTYSSISVEIPHPVVSQSFTSLDGPPSSPQLKASESSLNPNLASTPFLLQEVNGFDHQSTPVQMPMQDSTLAGTSSNKKGRSKACEECRKSKRRCIHDENGKVDPCKAAEPSKPRGSTSTKRPARLSDDLRVSAKKSRTDDGENDIGLVSQAQSALAEVFGDPAIEDDDFNLLIDPSLRPAIQQLQAAADAVTQCAQEMDEAAAPDPPASNSVQTNLSADAPTQAKVTIHVDPQIQLSTVIKTESHPTALPTSSSQISANSLVSPPDSLRNDDDESSPTTDHNHDMNKSMEMNGHDGVNNSNSSSSSNSSNDSTSSPSNALQTPKSAGSRHSSRQPKKVERYIPDVGPGRASVEKQQSLPSDAKSIKKESRRASSSAVSVGTAASTANVTLHGAGEGKSRPGIRRPSTPASASADISPGLQQQRRPQKQQQASSPSPKPNGPTGTIGRHSFSTVETETEADEESLRLIRALQEEEFGLRRRRSMKA